MGLHLIKNYFAVFYDNDGSYVYRRRISEADRKKKSFESKERKYIYDYDRFFDNFRYNGIFADNIYVFYNIHDPNPLKLRPFYNPVISAEKFNDIFQTNLIKQVNNINTNWLKNLLTPKFFIIAVLVIVAVYYFANGGKLW